MTINMLIAPGFEPLARIGLGWAVRSRIRREGHTDALKGYGALVGASVIYWTTLSGSVYASSIAPSAGGRRTGSEPPDRPHRGA